MKNKRPLPQLWHETMVGAQGTSPQTVTMISETASLRAAHPRCQPPYAKFSGWPVHSQQEGDDGGNDGRAQELGFASALSMALQSQPNPKAPPRQLAAALQPSLCFVCQWIFVWENIAL